MARKNLSGLSTMISPMRASCNWAPKSEAGAQTKNIPTSTISSPIRCVFICFISGLSSHLLNYAVHTFEKLARNFKTDNFGGRAVDDENWPVRRFDGNVCGLDPFQNLDDDFRRLVAD